MPELPEVETIRRQLMPAVSGTCIVDAWAFPSAKFTPARQAVGATIDSVQRRAKYLLFQLDTNQELIVHLGMTGVLSLSAHPQAAPMAEQADGRAAESMAGRVGAGPVGGPGAAPGHVRAWWRLRPPGQTDPGGDRYLLFDDVRRFGRIHITERGHYGNIPTLHHAGPEPLEQNFNPAHFYQHLRQSRRKIKTQLLSQRPVAGVGNIYADEALWLARINPRATRVGRARAELLFHAIRATLEQGIQNGGTTLKDYRNLDGSTGANQRRLAAYGRAGEPCLRCGITMVTAPIDGRSTTWCPNCQRR